MKFKYYGIIVEIDGKYYPIQAEFYNPYTCYLYGNDCMTIFGSFKTANKFKNIMIQWKKQNKYDKKVKLFTYVGIVELTQVEYFKGTK